MMRSARRAALLIAFSLLTSAATAHAECAWVLWWEISTTNEWQIVGAWPTADTCEKQRVAVYARSKLAVPEPGAQLEIGRLKDAPVHARWVCLPENVDPRGPKGK